MAISIVTIANVLISHAMEWGCYQNATLPTHHAMCLLLISLDCGLQRWNTLMVNSMHQHALTLQQI